MTTPPESLVVDDRGGRGSDGDELADGEAGGYRLGPVDRTVLTSPTFLAAVAGVVIGVVVLVWPDRTDRILARLVGLALVWGAFGAIRTGLRPPRSWSSTALALAAAVAGLYLLVLTPPDPAALLGRVIGAMAVVAAAAGLWRWFDGDDDGARSNRALLSAAVLAAAGALLLAFPEALVASLTTIVVLTWIGLSLVVIVISLDGRMTGVGNYERATDLVIDWLLDRHKSVDARQALYDKLLYEGPLAQQRIVRFFALMGFAAVIASMGVVTDSTAVVIGAMLIAPLMTPLMAMAISLVMGWPNRLARAGALAFAGIAFAITIGAIIGLVAPLVVDTATNTQIVARSTPTIADLITAVAAGAAGAYGLSRPDVSDSLPGVAIAISLVPPLTVVGIAYSQGDWASGNGALLLFATNMVAILVVGGLTFVVTGVTPINRVAENQHRVRTSLLAVGLAAILILGGLLLNGARIAGDAFNQTQIDDAVTIWLGDAPEHRLVQTTTDDDVVTVVVIGPSGGLGDVDDLAEALTSALGREIAVDVRLVVEERITSAGI